MAQRALTEIGMFTKDIRHIAGQNNSGSDYFSRLPPPDKKGTVYLDSAALEGHKLEALSPAVIFEEQQKCEEIKELVSKNKMILSALLFCHNVMRCFLDDSFVLSDAFELLLSILSCVQLCESSLVII